MNTKLQAFPTGLFATPEVADVLNELIGIAQRGAHIRAVNTTAGTLTKGTLVSVAGYDTDDAAAQMFLANRSTGAWATHVLSEDTAAGAVGIVYAVGVVTGLDTSAATDVGYGVYLGLAGAFEWAGPSQAGEISQWVGAVTVKDALAGAIWFNFASQAAVPIVAGAYWIPETGIPASDLAQTVQDAILAGANEASVVRGRVTLNGVNPTPVVFQGDTAATILGTDEAATKVLADGLTLIVDPDGAGDDTVTFAATAGTSVSDTGIPTDMLPTPGYSQSGEITVDAIAPTAGSSASGEGAPTSMVGNEDTKFKINVDGDLGGPYVATANWAGCITGPLVAAALQAAARAATTTLVTCEYWDEKYYFVSPTGGAASSVAITAADGADAGYNCVDDLLLGVTETSGADADTKLKISADGDAAEEVTFDWSACASLADMAAEMETKIQALGVNKGSVTVVVVGSTLKIISAIRAATSAIVITDADTVSCADSLQLGVANGGTEAGRTVKDHNLAIAVDEEDAVTVDVGDWLGCNDGPTVAQAVEDAIQALGGIYAAVTVTFGADTYTITSGMAGSNSAVVVTAAATADAADDLKLGVANGGAETAGTGDAGNIAAATAEEIAAAITAKASGWTAVAQDNQVRITSATEGGASSLAVNAASTADVLLGLAGTVYGAQGLGASADMENADYQVILQLVGVAQGSLAAKELSWKTPTVIGFDVECETAAATHDVDVFVWPVAS